MKKGVRGFTLILVTGLVLAFTFALVAAAASPILPRHPDPQTPQPDERGGSRADPSFLMSTTLTPELAKAMASAGSTERWNVIVEMRQQVSPATFAVRRPSDRSAARQQMVNAMQNTAQQSQVDVRAYLTTRWLAGDVEKVRPFWIFNGLAVEGARPDVIQNLAGRPDVAVVRLDQRRRWIEDDPLSITLDTPSQGQVEWGIARIRANEVWHTWGISGTDVVVANVDTGVDWHHPALHANYRGYSLTGLHQHEGHWYDATGQGALYPVDGNGHGTHTMGTIAGQEGIGVAPGARWIAVRAFGSDGYALDSWIHAGLEWLIAPNGDPTQAPDVVNNSWSSNISNLTTFHQDIAALRAAGILVIFSNGNHGPTKGSVGSPASLPGAFAVGASDQEDEIAYFSSRGPSPWGETRPHLAAPGVHVNSALPGGAYSLKQGTSMAAPHVAGTVALILDANPDMTITETASVLTRTAVPLSHVIPNNASGYGRVDAYAAVSLVTDAGQVRGTVKGDGTPLPGATIQATPLLNDLHGTTRSDKQGRYHLFLGAGHYDLTVSAFGYKTAHAHALSVTNGVTVVRNFDLTPLPTGQLYGHVSAKNGTPLEAQINVLDTPITCTAQNGSYLLDLPSGDYTLEARLLGYRVMTANLRISAGQSTNYDWVLPESLRILLIDGGAWHYHSQDIYYRQALDTLGYAYDLQALKQMPMDIPTFGQLVAYDVVIWSAPDYSPGIITAGDTLADYLSTGGNLLLSGQDIAFWDGGGNLRFYPYYTDMLYSLFRSDNAPSRHIVCQDDSIFAGMRLTIQGADGADNQRSPDQISIRRPDYVSLICHYEGGDGALVQTDVCNPYRALNLAFGFEAINDAQDRVQFMGRALEWFASPPQVVGVELSTQSEPVQVAPGGSALTHTLRLRNLGQAGTGDTFQIEIEGAQWETTLSHQQLALSPCAQGYADIRVDVPNGLNWDSSDRITVTAHSTVSPTLSQSMVLTSKVPAPILLVDDDRWYDQEQIYESALQAADAPYDRWDVLPKGTWGAGSPSAEVLSWYPIVLWYNAYDWFDPIHASELPRLTKYLDQGGRFFLSSQEYLYEIGTAALTRDYLGVVGYTWNISHTIMHGVPGNVLGDGVESATLDYPFPNWSTSLLPAYGSQVALRGQHGQPGGVNWEGACDGTAGCRWRTAFFAFPFEALPQAVRETLMSRLVGWLSWLGQSDLKADRTLAQLGDTVGYTLTLHNDGPQPVISAAVSNTLPIGTVLASGPAGGASYDPASRRVTWNGDLAPGATVSFTYQLQLVGGTGYVTTSHALHNTAEFILGAQGLHFKRQATVRMAAPDLSVSSIVHTPTPAKSFQPVSVTLVLRNDGLTDALSVTLDNPLPWPMHLVTGTATSAGGGQLAQWPRRNRISWEGTLNVGTPVTVTYHATAPMVLQTPTWFYNAIELRDGTGGAWARGTWLLVEPNRHYLPLLIKDETKQ